jgi:23S rRNA (guanosine2251-2'-O)-methyltransferase
MIRLNARELRTQEPDSDIAKSIKKNPITIICDNVLDTYNIGAIFRLADAVAAEKVYLCGATETPPNPKIKKASVSTWKWVDWEYASNTASLIKNLKFKIPNLKVIVVEQSKKSIPLASLKTTFPIAVVVGNETYGVTQDVVDLADVVVELPMYGINTSLNVMVSCGIVLYKLIEQMK